MGVDGRRKVGTPLEVGGRNIPAESEIGDELICNEGEHHERYEKYAFDEGANLSLYDAHANEMRPV